MTYDTYRYIFIGAAILCGIMFVASVLVFILMKIPKVISDLTGATARKAIKNIREQNEASGDKVYKASAFNEARGKLTDKISPSGNVVHQYQAQMPGIGTTKIETQELHVDEAANQTSVLDQYNETSLLSHEGAGETSVLSAPEQTYGETSVLSAPEQVFAETSELPAPEQTYAETSVLNPVVDTTFCVDFEITYIHTNEVVA